MDSVSSGVLCSRVDVFGDCVINTRAMLLIRSNPNVPLVPHLRDLGQLLAMLCTTQRVSVGIYVS